MDKPDETLYMLALTVLKGLTTKQRYLVLKQYGTAEKVFHHEDKQITQLEAALHHSAEALQWAKEELAYAKSCHIQVLVYGTSNYPRRLVEIDDPPLVLFYRGTVSLNLQHVIAVVGTRHITEYGKDICRLFIEELSHLLPNTLVVSGLAYGVDVHAHENALENGMSTVAVMAHGLDRIYPQVHRDVAVRMMQQGGILTEYPRGTKPMKGNFLRRNRIVAGMSDATIVVQSAARGGAMSTARLAQDYNRSVFAFPGRITDKYSEGCNNLININRAALITSAKDLLNMLMWDAEEQYLSPKVVEPLLFPEYSEEEQIIIDLMKKDEPQSVSVLSKKSKMSYPVVNRLLYGLVLKTVVIAMPGGLFRLKV